MLDGVYSGECDEQAGLMKRGVNILGIQAQTHLIRASTNTNVLDLEWMLIDVNGKKRKAWLMMDFDLGSGYDWNAFEGCCEAAGKWYAVWPHIKADSALELYRALGFQQYWVFTVNDVEPTEGWVFESLADPNPVPKA